MRLRSPPGTAAHMQKRAKKQILARLSMRVTVVGRRRSDLHYVGGLWALLALNDLELDLVALSKGLEAR